MERRVVVVATHGHCFDGMASAALFTRLLATLRDGAPLEARYRSCGYGPMMSTVPEEWLDGDENAILDFRYTASKRLTWYFDHHVTAFGSPAEQATALRAAEDSGAKPPHVYYDGTYTSCTKLIADVARETFDIPMDDLADLITWADTIDSARFASAEAAIDRSEPIMQLASVIEHHGDTKFLNDIVPRLLERPVRDVALRRELQDMFKPIAEAHDAFKRRVEQRSQIIGDVVFVNLTDAPLETAAKFVTYALHPESVYSVVVSRSKTHCKLSIGHNPWSGAARRHDIASICRRYGGGGHPAVGAASFPLNEIDRALGVARSVVEELNRPG